MSDCRLDTGDYDERKNALRLPLPFPPEMVKLEELSLDPHQHHHSECLPRSPSHQLVPVKTLASQGRVPIRAQYITSGECGRVIICARVVESEQKTPRGGSSGGNARRGAGSNQTKNIAKNYGKAIIAFMQRNKRLFRAVCRATATPYQRISEELAQLKAQLTTVMGFRAVWTTYKYAECMRMVSQVFLRRSALPYIFNSKVANVQNHLKYRNRFLKALRNPAAFDHIKDY